MMRISLVLLAASVAACVDDPPPEPAQVEQAVQVQPVVGDLLIEGCTPPPGDILITATESTATQTGQNSQSSQDAQGATTRAIVLPTRIAHRYAIVFPLLKARTAYTVSAVMTTAHCAKVAWTGPHRGFLVPGHTALHVVAYALRTQTEVLATRGPNHTPTAVGIDAIDIDTPGGAVRDLRWRTDVPGAVAGRVEIATDPFPIDPTGQQQDPPLLASFAVPLAQQGWSTVPAVDFAAPLMPPPCDLQQNPNGCPPVLSHLGVLHRAVQAGAPLYARVVPVDAQGGRLGGPALGAAAIVKLVHMRLPPDLLPPPPPTPALIIDQLFYFQATPEHASGYNRGCYTVNTPHVLPTSGDMDYWDAMLSTKYPPGATIPAGVNWCFSHSSGTLDDFADAVSGLVDAVGDLINDISKLYDDIKKAAVKAVASAIDDLHIVNCDALCQEALMTGLDAALAAVGMPPSLPNFDELADRGIDYLEDVAAEESGVPVELIDEARVIAAQAINDMKSHNALTDAPWLTPDDGFRPPQLQMFVRRDATSTATLPGVLRFSGGTTYHGSDVLLPREIPSGTDSKLITVQLLPDFAGIPAPPCTTIVYTDGFGHLTSTCVPPSDAEKQLYYEDKWFWNTLLTGCDTMTALEYGVGNFGDGALVYTPLVGLGVAWSFKPSTFQTIGGPYGDTCH